jgi:hypothetical protein
VELATFPDNVNAAATFLIGIGAGIAIRAKFWWRNKIHSCNRIKIHLV